MDTNTKNTNNHNFYYWITLITLFIFSLAARFLGFHKLFFI